MIPDKFPFTLLPGDLLTPFIVMDVDGLVFRFDNADAARAKQQELHEQGIESQRFNVFLTCSRAGWMPGKDH